MLQLDETKSEKKQIREKKRKDIARLRKLMKSGVVDFSYKKKDGSLRKAKGTLKTNLIPETDSDDKRLKSTNADCFTYYDLKRDDWRTFIKDNFIEIKETKK